MRRTSAVCAFAGALLASLAPLIFQPYISDHGQCVKRCGVSEARPIGDRCDCGDGVVVDRLNENIPLGYPFILKNTTVCTTDGRTLPEATSEIGVLHCSSCGACSSLDDVQALYNVRANVSAAVGPCIMRYVYAGAQSDVRCMEERVGFSRGCAECWVRDHECLMAHCHKECVLGGLFRYKSMIESVLFPSSPVGEIASTHTTEDACLLCMDHYCTKPFIDECGTNRRTAGVYSDSERDPNELCRTANAFSFQVP